MAKSYSRSTISLTLVGYLQWFKMSTESVDGRTRFRWRTASRTALRAARLAVLLTSVVLFTGSAALAQDDEVIHGLEWDGDGDERSMLYWDDPFPIYDATYIFHVYPRRKTGTYNYFTTFFWGNNGDFVWDGGNANTYYGAHPYPIPAPTGPGQWEISVWARDYVTGTEVEWDRWYTQAFRAWRESPTVTHHEFYYDLPDTSKVITATVTSSDWADQDPPSPAIVVGQAPDLNGQSWGGYPGWEEFNGVIRGIQIYSGLLSVSEIEAEIVSPMSTQAGRDLVWYLNRNPRPDDVADKKGSGTPNNPAWEGAPAAEWSGAAGTEPKPPQDLTVEIEGS